MIKVLYAPINFGDILQDGVYDAFKENGCQLEVFDFMNLYLKKKSSKNIREMLMRRCEAFKPHLMFLQIQHTNVIDASTLQRIKRFLPSVVIVNWTGDVRNYVPDTYRRIGMVADYNLISSTGQLNMFQNILKKRVDYLQTGYNPKLYFPQPWREKFDHDCVFIGHHNGKEKYPGANTRLHACAKMREVFKAKFALYGCHWPGNLHSKGPINQRDVMKAYGKSLVAISISHYNDLSHYFSDRLLMCMASGRPTVCLRFPGIEDYFTDMCDLVVAKDIDDLVKKIKMLKSDVELAKYIGEMGARKVFAEHTYSSMIKKLLHLTGFSSKV